MIQTDTHALAVAAAENCGYAIAVIEAFMKPPGTNTDQIREAISRLQETASDMQEFAKSTVQEGK